MSVENIGRRAPAVDKVLSDIREKIFLNQFEEGQPLSENMLAEMYGVSRGSIRTAIQVLESEGLIVVGKTGRKMPVHITEKFTRDLYDTRIMLELQAAKTCIEKPIVNSSIIATAFSGFYNLYSYNGEELYIERSRVNTAFHKAIIRMADNIILVKCWDIIEPLVYSMAKFNYIKLGERQSSDTLIESHQELMDLILRRDSMICQKLQEHIDVAVRETNWMLKEN